MKTIITIIFLLTFGLVYGQIVSNNLIAAYPFSGNAVDSLGGTTASIVNAAPAQGYFGSGNGAYEFNGQNDRIMTIADSIINQTAEFTIHFWAYIDSLYTPTETNYFLSSRHGAIGNEQGGVEFSYGDGGPIHFILRQISSATALASLSAPLPMTDQWFSITGVRTADSVFLYVNGALADSDIITNEQNHVTSDFWSIGAHYNPGPTIDREMDGMMDDILFYDTALSPCEIYHLHDRSPIQVVVALPVSLQYNGEAISCYGASDGHLVAIADHVLEPVEYMWSNGATTDTISGLDEGNYMLDIVDAAGCTSASSGYISQPDSLYFTASVEDATCNGWSSGSVNLNISGGTPAYAQDWFGADPGALSAGNYSVVVTDINGCSKSASFVINEPPELVVTGNTTDEIYGLDGTIDLTVSGGTGSYEYDWDNDGNGDFDDNQDLTALAGGTYTVVVLDSNLCSDTSSYIVKSQLSLQGAETNLISVFPNPTNSELIISTKQQIIKLELFDLTGTLVLREENSSVINLKRLPEGVYVLKVYGETRNYLVEKIVKR